MKKRKILLVTASTDELIIATVSKENKTGMKTTDDNSHYPLGLAYIHSYLEYVGNEVETLFLNNYTGQFCFKKVVESVNRFSPDIVGFQILTQNRSSTYDLIDFLRLNHPEIKIVIGGIHTTMLYRQLIKKYPFVVAIIGEGEITFSELAKELFKEKPNLSAIDGIAFCDKKSGDIISTQARELIKDLDSLPYPKHEIFIKNKQTTGMILTARGCPFNCSFCCLELITRRMVRKRSIVNVIQEIEWMINKFPQMDGIWIHDDTFFVDNNRVIEFCDEIIKRKIKLDFICSGRIKPINEEMVRKLEQANFKRVLFGLESGDNGVLKKCNKGIVQEDVINAYKLFAKTKISIFSHLILGLPGETEKTVIETANLIKKLQKIKYTPNYYAPFLTVFPGTQIYEISKKAGFIDDNYWLTNKPTPIFTVENNKEQLLKLQNLLMDRISLVRAFTSLAGFKAQLDIIPYHLKHILSNKKNAKNFFFRLAKFILPVKQYDFLKNSYHRFIR